MPNWYDNVKHSPSGPDIAHQAWEAVKSQIPDPHSRRGKYLDYMIQHVLRDQFHIPENEMPKLIQAVKRYTIEDSYVNMPDQSVVQHPWSKQHQQVALTARKRYAASGRN